MRIGTARVRRWGRGSGRSPHDREIVRLALPAFGALIAEPLYLLADTAIVGHLGTRQLGGIAIAAIVLTATFGIFNFLAYTTTGTVARHVGAGDERGRGRARDRRHLAGDRARGRAHGGRASLAVPAITVGDGRVARGPPVRHRVPAHLAARRAVRAHRPRRRRLPPRRAGHRAPRSSSRSAPTSRTSPSRSCWCTGSTRASPAPRGARSWRRPAPPSSSSRSCGARAHLRGATFAIRRAGHPRRGRRRQPARGPHRFAAPRAARDDGRRRPHLRHRAREPPGRVPDLDVPRARARRDRHRRPGAGRPLPRCRRRRRAPGRVARRMLELGIGAGVVVAVAVAVTRPGW